MPPRPGTSILGFGLSDWDSYWQTRQHILARLARRAWPASYTVPLHSIWDRSKPRWRDARWLRRSELRDGVNVIYPGRLPLLTERWPSLDRALMARHGRRCAEAMLAIAPGEVVAYVFHPTFYPYLRELDGTRVIFHADDTFSAMPGWSQELAARQRALVARADRIFATTEGVARSLGPGARGKTLLVPNGADTARFAAGRAEPLPADLARIPAPRLGYAGSLNEKVDFGLIDRIAAQRPDWHWALIGPRWPDRHLGQEARRAIASCERRPNVHFLGTKPFHHLPAYCAHVDVNVLCYRTDGEGWWRDIYPLKLHECLASGKPVLCSDLPAVREFGDVVAICRTADDWVNRIGAVLAGRDLGSQDARLAVARANDWDVRLHTIETQLQEVCAAPAGVPASARGRVGGRRALSQFVAQRLQAPRDP